MNILYAIILFILGASVGSFLNVVADRVPAGKSLLSPPSHCFKCGRRIESRDLIPVVSYIVLGGRCRYCGEKIPLRSLLVEASAGILFVLAWLQMGFSWPFISTLIMCCLFMIVFIVDLDYGKVPGMIIYPALVIALALALINQLLSIGHGIISSLEGLMLAAGISLITWLIARIYKGKFISLSDVLVMGLVGASVGFPLVIAAACLVLVAGCLATAVAAMFKLTALKSKIPLSPIASVAAVLTLLWGSMFWNWLSKSF